MTANPKVVLVVPTVRQECMRQFLDAWEPEFAGHELVVVEDNPDRTFDLRTSAIVSHYSWHDIDRELGGNRWIVPRRTDCVRSFGYWEAWRRKPDMIVTLDDDCMPPAGGPRGFLQAHWQRLQQGGNHDAWVSTTSGTIPRGVPYHARQRTAHCAINHGLWTNVIDYDAITQLAQSRTATPVGFPDQTIPRGAFYPMCGMNLAFRPEIAPAMYFLLMGKDWGVDRFGDIWCGLLSKRICDHLGWAVNSGSPTVHHARASNVWANLRKEAPGMERNETLWRIVDETVLTASSVTGCYRQLADALAAAAQGEDEWLRKVAAAMHLWTDLFTIVELPSRAPQGLPPNAAKTEAVR